MQRTAYPEGNARAARKTSTDGRSASEAIEAVAPALKAKLRQMVGTGKARVTEWKGGLQDGIRRKPIQAVLIATAVGAVIGLIVGRRSR